MARFDILMTYRTLVMLAVTLVAAGCSSGPSLGEYAAQAEELATTMNSRLDEIDVILEGRATSVAEVRTYADDRMAARRAFLAGFEELDPPREAEELHTAALDILRDLVDAEQELADLAYAADDLATLDGLWDSPTGQKAREVDAQVVALCQAAQASLNSTQERQALVGQPWIPSELQEVVDVSFGCTVEDRRP
jgi:hypothetical protein